MFLPSCSGTDLLKEIEMQPAIRSGPVLALALAAACWATPELCAAASAAEGEPRLIEMQRQTGAVASAATDWWDRITAAAAEARALIVAGHERAPALVLILPALLLLPAAALVSFLLHARARRRKERALSRALELKSATATTTEEPPAGAAAPLWSQQAWLSLEGGEARTLPLAGQVIRIGRHQDNDIRLPDTLVHRYHAVIEHTAEEEFVITDLSGKDGNGLFVNGERLARAQLADGDIIELGRTRLKFESAPV
jgi:hypothetical protein